MRAFSRFNPSRIALLWIFFLCASVAPAEPPVIGMVYAAPHFEKLNAGQEDPLALYRTAVEKQDAVIMVIGQGMPDAEVQEKLNQIDGLLLPGGIDVEPARYNEAPHPMLEKTDAALDALEWHVLEFARDHRLPVLGICRGHQVINVFYGGSLIQDIPAQHKSPVSVKHRGGKITHAVTIEEKTLLRELLGKNRIEVNSYHHQAVKDLAPGFRVAARTDDGIIEAIESIDDVFILGVQFHPEKMLGHNPEFKALFARFIQEVRNTHPPVIQRTTDRPLP